MTDFVDVEVEGTRSRIEYRVIEGPDEAPRLVFLHEGLGSMAMWKDFPDRLCAAGGWRGLVHSRAGYGDSPPRPHERPFAPDFMHREAWAALPALFVALGIDTRRDRPVLFGHSDGGSIALLHAAAFPKRVSAAVVLAPHLFVEQVGVAAIAAMGKAYESQPELRERLARYHRDVDAVFRGWNDIWLDPGFADWNIETELQRIACPVLAIQGREDAYGTMQQIDDIARALPATQLLKLDACGHAPHRDQPDAVIAATVAFLATNFHAPGRASAHPHASPHPITQEDS